MNTLRGSLGNAANVARCNSRHLYAVSRLLNHTAGSSSPSLPDASASIVWTAFAKLKASRIPLSAKKSRAIAYIQVLLALIGRFDPIIVAQFRR